MKKVFIFGCLVLLMSCGANKKQKIQVLDGSIENDRLDLINSQALVSKDLNMTLVARLNPPEVNGMVGQSTSIDIKGNKAYVSFNVKGGEFQRGAISILNLNNTPSIDKELRFLDRDVNYIKVDGNKIGMTGAKTGDLDNAYYQEIKLTGNNVSVELTKVLPSFAGNHIQEDEKFVYVSSGDTGGLSVFEKNTMNLKFYSDIEDSRSVAKDVCGRGVSVLSGVQGKVVKYSRNKIETSSNSSGDEVIIGGDGVREARSEIISGLDYNVVSLGENGFKVLCNEDNRVMASVGVPSRSGVDPSEIRTNGIAGQNGLLFVAQGGAGLYVYSMTKTGSKPLKGCQDIVITEIGKSIMSIGDSVNSVSVKGDTVITSNGKGGVEIFKYNKHAKTNDVLDFNEEYQGRECQNKKAMEDCDSVMELEPTNGAVLIPARKGDKECFALKIIDKKNNQSSQNYSDRLDGVLGRDHDLGVNKNPRIMSESHYTIKMLGEREVLLSGDKMGLSDYSVDNFFLFKIRSNNSQWFGMGTGDSKAIGYNAPVVNIANVWTEIPFEVKANGGSAQYTENTILSEKMTFPQGQNFQFDSYALDMGRVGETSDLYMIFK